MARPTSISARAVAAIRAVTGAPVASDNASLVDANFPVAPSSTLGGAFDCATFDTILIGVELAGGTSPTCTLDLLFRDPGAADGERWKREASTAGGTPIVYAFGTTTHFVEVAVGGWLIYPRFTVTGNPTSVKILARPGRRLAPLQRSGADAWE